jgi:hypothetical protein
MMNVHGHESHDRLCRGKQAKVDDVHRPASGLGTPGGTSSRQRSGRRHRTVMSRNQCEVTCLRASTARTCVRCGGREWLCTCNVRQRLHDYGACERKKKYSNSPSACVCRLQMKYFHYALLIKCFLCMIIVYWCKKFPYFTHVYG